MNALGTSQICGAMDQNERRKLLQNHPLLKLLNGYTDLLQYPCETNTFGIHKFGFPEKFAFSQNVVSRMPTWKLPFVTLQSESEKYKNTVLLIHEIDIIATERYDNPHKENNCVETLVFTVPDTVYMEYYQSIERWDMSNKAICAFTVCTDALFWMNRTCKTLSGFRYMIDKNVQVAEWTTITMNKSSPDLSMISPLWESFIRLSFIPDDVLNDLFAIVKAITGFKNAYKDALIDAATAFSYIITLAGQCKHNRFVAILREIGGIQKLQPYQAASKLKAAIIQEMNNNKEVSDTCPNAIRQKRPSVELIEPPNVSPPKIMNKQQLLPTPATKPTTMEKNQPSRSTAPEKTVPRTAPVCPPPPVFQATPLSSTAPKPNAASQQPSGSTTKGSTTQPTATVTQPAPSTHKKTAPACPPPPVPPAGNLPSDPRKNPAPSPQPNVASIPTNATPVIEKLMGLSFPNTPTSTTDKSNDPSVKSPATTDTFSVKQPAVNTQNKQVSVIEKPKVYSTPPPPMPPKTVKDPRRKPILPPEKSAQPSPVNKPKPTAAAPITTKTAPQTQQPITNMPKEMMRRAIIEDAQAETSKTQNKPDTNVKVSSSESSSSSSTRKNSESEPQATIVKEVPVQPSSVLDPPPMAPNLKVLNPQDRIINIESPTVPSDPTPAVPTTVPGGYKTPERLYPESGTSTATLSDGKRTSDDHDYCESNKRPRIDSITEPEKSKSMNLKTEEKLFEDTSTIAFSDTKSWFKPIFAETVQEDRMEERKFSSILRARPSEIPDNMSTMVEEDTLDLWEKEQLLEPDDRVDQPCTSTTTNETPEAGKEEQTPESSSTSPLYDLARASEAARILCSLAESIERLENRGYEVNETFLQGIIRKKN